MPVTSTSICNSALAKLGADRIVSLEADNHRARLLKEQYEKIRDELLYSHPWNFAIKNVEIAPLVDAPLFYFSAQFQLPSDCLRVIGSDLPKEAEWKIEGTKLLCNYDNIKIKYISREEDTATYTPGFVELLACKIAYDIAYAVTQNVEVVALMQRNYEKKLREVRSFDAQESMGDRVYADSWLNSRA